MLQTFMTTCRESRFWNDESGQDLVEYSLLGALIAVACVATMTSLATAIQTEFGVITAAL